jgi:hypothetical protein
MADEICKSANDDRAAADILAGPLLKAAQSRSKDKVSPAKKASLRKKLAAFKGA